MDDPRERPLTTDEEIERTGRDEQVAGFEANDGQPELPGLDDDDAAEGGVDSAEFPGAGAP